MMNFCLAVLAVLLPVISSASPANDAWEVFKGFKGKWKIQSEGKTLSTAMTYEDGSKGSIITEQFGKELSVISRDGAELIITHFCNIGNQPRLRLKVDNSKDKFEFDLYDITNLKNSASPHVQKVIYKIIGSNQIALEIVWQKDKVTESENYILSKAD